MARGKMICVGCGKNTTYRVTKPEEYCSECFAQHPEQVHSDDKRRVNLKLCPSCFRKELKQQLFDEVGGILGNITIKPEPETLVELAKVLVKYGKTSYYQASEYLVFRALKDNQDAENNVLMIPDGDVASLSKET